MPNSDSRVSTDIRQQIAVTVLLERSLVQRERWQMPLWSLGGVLVGEHLAHAGSAGERVRLEACGAAAPDANIPVVETYAWSGFQVTLYKDACERYWHALIGDQPRVYVMCCDTDDGVGGSGLCPVKVSVDYDEAISFCETDLQVLSASIPGELYRQMEAFVLKHYQPKPFAKRKRRQWDGDDPQPPAQPGR